MSLKESVKLELEHQALRESSKRRKTSMSTIKIPSKVLEENAVIHIAHLEESVRKIVGIDEVYGRVYDLLNFTNCFKHPQQNKFSAGILKDIVLARIAQPCSKRSSVAFLKESCDKSLKTMLIYKNDTAIY